MAADLTGLIQAIQAQTDMMLADSAARSQAALLGLQPPPPLAPGDMGEADILRALRADANLKAQVVALIRGAAPKPTG